MVRNRDVDQIERALDAGRFAGASGLDRHRRTQLTQRHRDDAGRIAEIDQGRAKQRGEVQELGCQAVDAAIKRVATGIIVNVDCGEQVACPQFHQNALRQRVLGRGSAIPDPVEIRLVGQVPQSRFSRMNIADKNQQVARQSMVTQPARQPL